VRRIYHVDYPADVDQRMIPLLDVLNSIPGCRTLRSREGNGADPFYVSLAICSRFFAYKFKLWLKKTIPDVEFDSKDAPNGLLDYELFMRVSSREIGMLPDEKRLEMIGKLTSGLMDFVPEDLPGIDKTPRFPI